MISVDRRPRQLHSIDVSRGTTRSATPPSSSSRCWASSVALRDVLIQRNESRKENLSIALDFVRFSARSSPHGEKEKKKKKKKIYCGASPCRERRIDFL